ncbi:cytochrome P450 [Xylariaceae sp. FL0804]|nr:cytochrome P450 [Xylariaceae sp. FL0804]
MNEGVVDDHGYLMAFNHAIHPALSPGPELDALNRVSIETLSDALSALYTKPVRMQLYKWARNKIFMASAEGVYRPMNPMRDPRVEAAWYKFEPTIVLFLINLMPKLLAPEAYRSREIVVKGLTTYFRDGGHEKASGLTKRRYEHKSSFNLPLDDIARTEVGNIFALIGNTAPATFWMIYHRYSDPDLLEDCRQEVSQVIRADGQKCEIDITNVKARCPTLLSALQEVLRFYGTGISTREVLEDYVLGGKYLLKKGNMVMILSPVQHTFREIWGYNVDEFDARQFVRSPQRLRPNPVAFRGFGGGTVLCPGRHFASTETLAFIALLIMRFDIQPVGGKWVMPGTDKAPPSASVAPPDVDMDVDIIPRDRRKWHIAFTVSDKTMETAAEDIH